MLKRHLCFSFLSVAFLSGQESLVKEETPGLASAAPTTPTVGREREEFGNEPLRATYKGLPPSRIGRGRRLWKGPGGPLMKFLAPISKKGQAEISDTTGAGLFSKQSEN